MVAGPEGGRDAELFSAFATAGYYDSHRVLADVPGARGEL